MALGLHLCMVVWPHKFYPHLPEKYDGAVNPAEFLQIYSTSILTVGGDETIMANYFLVALIETARSWLMNLPEGTLDSWSKLCTSSRPTLRVPTLSRATRPTSTPSSSAQGNPCAPSFNGSPRFTIPFPCLQCFVVVVFRQGVRDERMLEKLITHNIQDVSALFSLVDKCTRAIEGRA
jgi:hypothetical protein